MQLEPGIDAARERALREAFEALERVLLLGLSALPDAPRDLVRHRVIVDGCRVEFTVVMGAGAHLVCALATPDASSRVELFRVEIDAPPIDASKLN